MRGSRFCGEKNHRRGVFAFAQLSDGLSAIELGHIKVENNKVEGLGR